jgi:hypothetical protein
VKLAESAVQSYGGLTTVTDYHLIPRQEDVVDSTFMHDNYASPGARWVAGVCKRRQVALFTLACAELHPWGSATHCARMAALICGVLSLRISSLMHGSLPADNPSQMVIKLV